MGMSPILSLTRMDKSASDAVVLAPGQKPTLFRQKIDIYARCRDPTGGDLIRLGCVETNEDARLTPEHTRHHPPATNEQTPKREPLHPYMRGKKI